MQEEPRETESCFVAFAGLIRVFDPGCGKDPSGKKHPCPDCHFCQGCSDARCHACRGDKNRQCQTRQCRKLSLREQIALYERVNRATP
jgi:hypothetical protein